VALPVMTVLAPSPKVNRQLNRRHKTIAQWARQMITKVRRVHSTRADKDV
jgi:U3 small nucleolar RNA-associated protein 14